MPAKNLFEALESRQLFSTFTVANFLDSGAGSLRQAVLDANAAPGADVVAFAAGLNGGTIGLTTGGLAITDGLTINGPGATLLTISGNNASRVFYSTGSTSINGLTITGGNGVGSVDSGSGGGIANFGALTLTNSTVSGNTSAYLGGGIANGGTLTLTNSTVAGNTTADNGGGGIFNHNNGTLTLTNSTVAGNTAPYGYGGGIFQSGGTLTMTNSTVSGNTALFLGGGIYGVLGPLTLTNSTVSGNTADEGGGIYKYLGILSLTNSTVSGNNATSGGGINNVGTATLTSTIVAGNTGGDIFGTLESGSTNNLIQDAANAGGLVNGVNANIVGVDPLLGPLAVNGGPTRTHALPAGSPAIGTGINPLGLPTDQRAGLFARGTSVDIGAYQRQGPFALVVDTLSDADDGNYSAGNLSLREAITVGANPGIDTITFSPALNGGTITLAGTELSIANDLTISGPGAALLTISGNNASRVFYSTGTTSISGLTITGGNSVGALQGGRGGGIYQAGGTLTLINSTVSGNNATSNPGGGIYQAGGTLTLTNSTVSGNNATSGGGIQSLGTLTLTNSTVSGNNAASGSGIYNGGTLTLTNSTVSGNNATIGGGGITNGGTLTLTNSTVSGNTATFLGGGIENNGTLTLTNSTVSGNTATYDGGGIRSNATLTLTNSTVSGNNATNGGGINNVGTATLTSTIVAGNTGGDIFGTLESGSTNNLVQDAANAGGLVNGVNANIVGVDPLLGPLAFNGGPTRTQALLAGSPAINKGINPGALATDQRGSARTRGAAIDIGAFEYNAIPTIVSLTPSASSVARGQSVTLTANSVADGDGTIARVDFYRDANTNGTADAGELIGSDSNSAGGYTLNLAATGGLPLGSSSFLAVAVDNDGGLSTPKAASVTFTNVAPTLASLTPSVSSLAQGDTLTLTAGGAADVDGPVAGISFYIDTNKNGVADFGERLATTTNVSGGSASYTLTTAQSNALPTGSVKFLAVATDSDSATSNVAQAFATLVFSTRAGALGLPAGAADSTNAHRVVSVNANGHLILFEQGWAVADLQEKTGAPNAIGQAVIWVDPKDDLTYVAAPSAAGLILFTRAASGSWSVRNLTLETAAPASPTGNLTRFFSKGSIVVLAGTADDGNLVSFQQTGAAGPAGGPAFAFVDVSAQVTANGGTTPTLTNLISWVTDWDAWNLAGIDANGDIQAVWFHNTGGAVTNWRLDNLSDLTSAPPLTGQLAVTLTPWGGMSLTGLDSNGNVVATWWVPDAPWRTNNLTADLNAAPLSSGNISGFTTPWGGQSYVGLSQGEGGVVTVYWWVPGMQAWSIDPLLPETVPASHRLAGELTSSSSAAGTLNVYGTSATGEVLRMWWAQGQAQWAVDDLTQVAVRA